MREYGFSLTRILPYKDRIYDSVLTPRIRVSENSSSPISYAVFMFCSKARNVILPKNGDLINPTKRFIFSKMTKLESRLNRNFLFPKQFKYYKVHSK